MMHFPALGREQLSRFSYHWLFGIQVNQPGARTLFDEAEYLESNEEARERIQRQMKYVQSLLQFISVIYWLFNISEYRTNYYKWHAFVSWTFYQHKLLEEDRTNQKTAKHDGFLVLSDYNLSYSWFGQDLGNEKHWFLRKTEPYLPNRIVRNVHRFQDASIEQWLYWNTPASYYKSMKLLARANSGLKSNQDTKVVLKDNDTFVIKQNMLCHLTKLGLSLMVNQKYTLKELKTAYHAAMKRTHPDKSGYDSHNDCVDISKAYKAILESILDRSSDNDMISNLWDDVSNLEKQVKEASTEIKAYFAHVDDYCARVEVVGKKASNFLSAARERQAAQQVFLDRLEKLVKEQEEKRAEDDAVNAALGIPPITEEDREGFRKDPDYYRKQAEQRRLNQQTMFKGLSQDANIIEGVATTSSLSNGL